MLLLAACSKPASTTIAAVDSTTIPVSTLADTAVTPAPAPAAALTPRPDTVYINRPVPVRVPARPPVRREPPRDRDRNAPPVRSVSEPPRPDRPSQLTLAQGTTIRTTAIDSIHSRYSRVGDAIRVRVAENVNENGRTVIPAGSIVTLTISAIGGASNRGERGTLALQARDVAIDGRSAPIHARATDILFEMKGRGVGAGEVEKTGAGVAVGAVIGHILGGGTGTVVGAVAGGAGGAAIAAKTADRDIVVHSGAPITLQLTDDFSERL
jgi:hypothetical protein